MLFLAIMKNQSDKNRRLGWHMVYFSKERGGIGLGFLSVIIVAVGLSLDAMAVALINSACYRMGNDKKLWLMPIFFGFFQSLMPFLGALVGNGLSYFLGDKINFMTFFIFLVLGVKMIYEGFHQGDGVCAIGTLSYGMLLSQSVATSIDAFAVGLLLVSTNTPLPYVLAIGLTTFVLVSLVIYFGQKVGHYLGKHASLIGGLVFIMLGIYHLLD